MGRAGRARADAQLGVGEGAPGAKFAGPPRCRLPSLASILRPERSDRWEGWGSRVGVPGAAAARRHPGRRLRPRGPPPPGSGLGLRLALRRPVKCETPGVLGVDGLVAGLTRRGLLFLLGSPALTTVPAAAGGPTWSPTAREPAVPQVAEIGQQAVIAPPTQKSSPPTLITAFPIVVVSRRVTLRVMSPLKVVLQISVISPRTLVRLKFGRREGALQMTPGRSERPVGLGHQVWTQMGLGHRQWEWVSVR